MIEEHIRIRALMNRGDVRGNSFNIPEETFRFIRNMNDVHIASVAPGCIRGNHYHVERKEFIVVLYSGSWSLGWDSGKGTNARTENFEGEGAALVEIEPDISHAIKNTGKNELIIIAVSSVRYDPSKPDTVKRVVIS